MSKAYINPHDLFPSQQYGFSQVVSTRGTTTVYLSGQVAWNARGEIVHPLDLGGQTRLALENVETAVRAAGGTRADIVSLRLYIVGDHIHNASIKTPNSTGRPDPRRRLAPMTGLFWSMITSDSTVTLMGR